MTLTFPNLSAGTLEKVNGNYALNPSSSETRPHNIHSYNNLTSIARVTVIGNKTSNTALHPRLCLTCHYMTVLTATPAVRTPITWHFNCAGELGPDFEARQPKKSKLWFH